MNCPHCGHELTPEEVARLMGSIKSDARAAASRLNGAKGGRPRKIISPSPHGETQDIVPREDLAKAQLPSENP